MNQAGRWREFLRWWKALDIKKYNDELGLYADVWGKIEQLKGAK